MRALIDEPTHEQWELCQNWHGGQSSMMYAVASTGDLTTGSVRPSTYDEYSHGLPVWRPMTDDEWLAELAYGLEWEARQCLKILETRPDMMAEAGDDIGPLTELAELAERSGDHWQERVEAHEGN